MTPGMWLAVDPARIVPEHALVLHFPYAGGHAASYRSWAKRLGPGRDYVGVELPGRGARFGEPFADSVDSVADAVVSELVQLPGHPVALFGHSVGALMAYEVAIRLEALGRPVLALVVSGQRAPHDGPGHPRLADLPDDLFITRLAELDLLDTTMFADPDLCDLFTPVLRADLRMTEDYPWGRAQKIDSPVTALAGTSDRVLPPTALERWRQLARRDFRSAVVPGHHMFVTTSADTVVKELRDALDAGPPSGPAPGRPEGDG